jgi:hypothetical protein
MELLEQAPDSVLDRVLAYLQGITDASSDIPNAVTAQAIQDAHNGVGLSRGFSSVAQLMEDLNADD